MEKQQLQYRDVFILYILAGLGVCRMLDLQILAGFNNSSYCRRRVSVLAKLGLVASEYWGNEKIYFLTAKGYLRIEHFHATYKPSHHTSHDIGVARLCSYLYLKDGVSYWDFFTDRQMFYRMRGSSVHRPDIVVGNACFEFERSIKNYKILRANMKANVKYDKQIWLIEDANKRLQKKLKQIAEEDFLSNVDILSYEQVDAFVRSADLSTNTLRSTPTLGQRNFDIVLQDTSSDEEFKNYLQKREDFRYDL